MDKSARITDESARITDESAFRDLLTHAADEDQMPIGPLASTSLQAGLRLRRRRRILAAGLSAAAVAAIAVAVPAVHGSPGRIQAASSPPAGAMAYVVSAGKQCLPVGRCSGQGTGRGVTPISIATGKAGKAV